MRVRSLIPLIVVVAVTGIAFALLADSEPRPRPPSTATVAAAPSRAPGLALPARVVTAGAVTVSIEPVRIDETGATFEIGMETHTEELSTDLERTATLVLDGVEWEGVAWVGDPPGGHHRSGELTFEASGEATGSVVLSIGGFTEPVEATWPSTT